LAGSFVVEIPLYPDLSIESRGTVILREFGLIRNENAAFFGFFRRNVGPGVWIFFLIVLSIYLYPEKRGIVAKKICKIF